MALTADKARAYTTTALQSYPVAASTRIFEGSAVGETGGYARSLQAGDTFLGFAAYQADNREGTNSALRVEVHRKPVELAVESVTVADVGKPVYATDDNTFTLVKGANSHIGYVSRFVSSGMAIIEVEIGRELMIADLETP